ncbi:MAG TPA: imidazole glycerol phosphate synthase subunit HisH [Candidatus Limnocylindrales bacterium]
MTGAPADRALRIVVADYGAGNLVSIGQALTAVGATVVVSPSPSALTHADALVVPGVGAAAPAMERLEAQGLVEPIRRWIADDRPYLGICLGLQLLFEGSDEDGAETIGVLPGRTVLLDGAPTLPHIGWNQVERRASHPIFDAIAPDADFYFVHSYVGRPDPTVAGDIVLAETDHGGRFASAIGAGSLVGVQFHPERSGADGVRLMANFVAFAAARARRVPPAPILARQGAA